MARLLKFTRGNQLTIPQEIIRQAGLEPTKDYLSVEYLKGVIVLKPVEIEERIPSQVYEKLLDHVFDAEEGDIITGPREAGKVLRKRKK